MGHLSLKRTKTKINGYFYTLGIGQFRNMLKKFNTTGVCIPTKHYMADVSEKVEQIAAMVEEGKYFTINRPRQYGKTTMLYLLFKYFQEKKHYLPIKISFEGIGKESFQSEAIFCQHFLQRIAKNISIQDEQLALFIRQQIHPNFTIGDLSEGHFKDCSESWEKSDFTH